MGLFNIHKKKFTYQSDAQLKEALINKKGKQRQQDAFDYVFNKYDALLKNLVKSTFEVSEEEAERTTTAPNSIFTIRTIPPLRIGLPRSRRGSLNWYLTPNYMKATEKVTLLSSTNDTRKYLWK